MIYEAIQGGKQAERCKTSSSVPLLKFGDADCLWSGSALVLLAYLHASEQFFGCVALLYSCLSLCVWISIHVFKQDLLSAIRFSDVHAELLHYHVARGISMRL